MTRRSPVVFVLVLCTVLFAINPVLAQPTGGWPSVSQQLQRHGVGNGTALAALIMSNQDFSLLRADEANDKIGLPPWLRVYWRKNHPEATYSADDPTGGYPRVANEVLEWMVHHQDLRRAPKEPDVPPSSRVALSVSGSTTSPRSESDIRIDYWNPARIISASNAIVSGGAQAQYYTSDSGATWGRTTLPFASGDTSHSDPTVDWTSEGTAWATTIGVQGSKLFMRSYRSSNGGATWTFDNTFSGTQSNTDKQLMWTDHSASSAFKDYIYAIWHNGAPAFMNRRSGPGGTWGTPIQISGAESTGTCIGSDVTSNSAGVVFAFWPTTGNSRIFMVKSTNGGTSYSAPQQVALTFDSYDIGVPSFASRRALIYASAGAYKNVAAAKDNVYASWTDLTGATGCTTPANEPGTSTTSGCTTRVWFTRSTNGGTTWEAARMVNNPSSLNDQFNQRLVVDETTGRIGMMYYDTINDPGRKKTDVFFQSSTDDGATWSTPQKVTSGMTDETVAGANSGNQYGDYNGLSGYNGTFFPSWTDRSASSQEQIWTNSTSTTSCTPPAAPVGLTAAGGQARVDLSWGAVANVSEYHIDRATVLGGPYSQVGTSTTTTFNDLNLAAGTYYYVVRSFVSCESANSNQASATATAPPVGPDFALSVSPPSASVSRSVGTATYTVTITPSGGFTGAVTLSVSGQPSGSTATFSPNPATTSSTLTITIASGTARTTYPLTITGASGSLSHTASASLTVTK
ncbi:MAG TPA: sialidase family protein [Thermoanaerobaculia bacterium]|nr:sialidase family protein [Thermoanaerobaculia bacterium]